MKLETIGIYDENGNKRFVNTDEVELILKTKKGWRKTKTRIAKPKKEIVNPAPEPESEVE